MQEFSLDQVCLNITDGAHNSPPSMPEGLPMGSVKDMSEFGINLATCRKISEADYETLVKQGCQPKENDVLIAKDGATALDTVCLVKPPLDFVLLSSIAILRPNPTVILPYYLKLYLQSERVRSYMKSSFISGAAIPRVVLKDFKQVRIKIPSLEIQKKVVNIISAYDDLIENNTRRIRILEKMAQAIYREWFVHFRFPGHEGVRMVESPLGPIPEGWEVSRLDDSLLLQRGFDLPISQRIEGNVPVYAATGIVGYHNVAKAIGPGVITGRSGSLGSVNYVHENYWPLNTTLWVKEFRSATPRYAYYLLRDLKLEQFNSGVAVPTLNRNDIHGLQVIIPSRNILDHFEEILTPVFDSVRNNNLRNENLRQQRDLLLPQLISGKIKIN